MDKTVLSILLFVLGLGIGLALVFLFNFLKNKKDSNKADTIIDKAKKEAEKIKRDSLFETKEEIHKLKLEADKEIKEKKIGFFKEKIILTEGILPFKIEKLLLKKEKIIYLINSKKFKKLKKKWKK